MIQKQTLTEAANACGEASALLARYRALLAGAGSINSPAVTHAAADIRRVVAQLECTAIALASAQRLEGAAA